MSSPRFTTSNELFSLLNDEAIYDEVITAQFTDDPSFNIDFQLSSSFTPFQEQVQVQTNCSDIQYSTTQAAAFPFKPPTPLPPSYANTCASLPSNTSFYHTFPSPAVSTVPSPQFEIPVLYYSFPEVKITETHYSSTQYQPANPLYCSNDSYTSKSYQSFRSTAPSKPKSRSYPTSPQDSHSPTTSPSTTSPSTSPSSSTTTSPRSQTTLHPTSATTKTHSRAQSQSPPHRAYKPKEPKQQRRNDHSGDFRKVFFQQLETDMAALAEWTTFMASHGCPKPRVCVRTHLAFCDMRTQKYGEKDSFAALRLNPKWRRLGSRTFCECMSFGPCYVAHKS